jgi:hypothetical protein
MGTAGQALSPSVQVAVEDAFGNVVTSDTSTVAIAVASGPGGFTGGSTISVAAVKGVATFSNLVLNQAGSYTLSASDGSLAGAVSITITLNLPGTSKLVFLQTPTTGTAGQVLNPFVKVAVESQNGSVLSSDSSTITLTLSSGVFAGGSRTSTVRAVNGVATFSNLVVNQAGSYTLSASDGSLTGPTSRSFTVNPAAANKLVFMQTPAAGTAGQALSPSVQVVVEDRFGNVVTGNRSTITLLVHSGPGGFANGSTTRIAAVNGVATFSKLFLTEVGSYALSAADGSLTGAISSSITVNPAAAYKLVFLKTPTLGNVGQVLSPTVQVAVEDRFGNVLTGDSSYVTIAVNTGPIGFRSNSTVKVVAVNGVATFNNLIFNMAGTYTLAAWDFNLSSPVSVPIIVR